jgi:hydroxyacylglutathione hydrolase
MPIWSYMQSQARSPRSAALAAVALVSVLAGDGPGQDAERGTHSGDSATPRASFEQRGDDHLLRQYQLGCLSLLSYLLVSGGEAVIVDPQRDVDHYIRDLEALGARLVWILLTHPHADFVAGHTELAHRTGARIAISEDARAGFAHEALADAAVLPVGTIHLEHWKTPGHTLDCSTFVVRAGGRPRYAFTGDTLFIGSIGRPDLLDRPPAELAALSYRSVQKLLTLPDDVLILPAHGAGSLCGAHLSPETVATLGAEKQTNPYLRMRSEASFISSVISHKVIVPDYFRFNVDLNRKGPPLVEREPGLPPRLDAEALRRHHAGGGYFVDLRDQAVYARAHVRGALNISLRGRLDTWTGSVVPFDAPLVLVGREAEVREGAFRLRRIGLDRTAGWVDDDPDSWRAAGLPVTRSTLLAPGELAGLLRERKEPILIDVRTAEEFEDLRLADGGNIPVTESGRFGTTLDKGRPVVMLCNSAYRSSLAVGLAERQGFELVGSLDGGLDAWIQAGLPIHGRLASQVRPASPVAAPDPEAAILLPEPLEPATLARALMDQPGNYAVLDLRPAWQFAAWSLPGSQSAPAESLVARVAAVPPGKRLVLVDRDGTTAFAAAGALLARDPSRPVRVLVGGLARYHDEMLLGAPPPAAGMGTAPASPLPAGSAPLVPAPAGPAPRRKAGC